MRIFPKQDNPEWKFQNNNGTNLAYDMLFEPTSKDDKEKEGYILNGNRLINLKIFTTNTEKYFVCQQFAHEKGLHM